MLLVSHHGKVHLRREWLTSYLNQLYARDMAKYIMENLKEKAYDRAKESAVAFSSSRLVTHTMPTFAVKVKSDDNALATVTFKKRERSFMIKKLVRVNHYPFSMPIA